MTDLKTLALAATPGPWMLLSVGDDDKNIAVCDKMGVSLLTVRSEGDVNFAAVYEDADAVYIAAASPDAILKLLEERDMLREAMARIIEVNRSPIGDSKAFKVISEIARQALEAAS